MTGKTHRIIGIASGLTYFLFSSDPHYSPATLGAVLVGSYFSSLIPDLDQPAADFWDSLPFGHTLAEAVDPFFKHRNISHSIIGLIIFSSAIYYLFRIFPEYWGINTPLVFISCLVAYGSHLLADMLTEEGIPLFLPYHRMVGIPPRPFERVRIKTGHWFENLLIFPVVNLWLMLTIVLSWDKIKLILYK